MKKKGRTWLKGCKFIFTHYRKMTISIQKNNEEFADLDNYDKLCSLVKSNITLRSSLN